MQRLSSFLFRHIIAIVVLTIVSCAGAVFTLQAWWHTGRIVYFAYTETLTFDMPNGITQQIAIPANTAISVVRQDAGHAHVRIWVKKTGYVFSPISLANSNDDAPISR